MKLKEIMKCIEAHNKLASLFQNHKDQYHELELALFVNCHRIVAVQTYEQLRYAMPKELDEDLVMLLHDHDFKDHNETIAYESRVWGYQRVSIYLAIYNKGE